MLYIVTDEYPEFIRICREKKVHRMEVIFVDKPYKIYGRSITDQDEIIYGRYLSPEKHHHYEIEFAPRKKR